MIIIGLILIVATPRNKSILALKMAVSGNDAQDEVDSLQNFQSNLQKVKSYNVELKKQVKSLRSKVILLQHVHTILNFCVVNELQKNCYVIF